MNNQRSFANAVHQYVGAKGYYPGYRQILNVVNNSSGNTQPAVINWQVALMPYLDKLDVYQAIKNGTIGQAPPTVNPQRLALLGSFSLSQRQLNFGAQQSMDELRCEHWPAG